MHKPWRTCREVVTLISERRDRTLSTKEHAVVRFHALVCAQCTRWERHALFMRQGITVWKNYED